MRSAGKTWLARGVLLAAALVGSGAVQAEVDPFEPFNRAVFRFNDTVDTYTLRPLAQGYQRVTPEPVQQGVSNVFNNLGEVVNLTNNVLQGKFRDAGIDTSRLLFNSTFGVLGIFDVATRMGLPRNDEDFGQTLGVWGLDSGPYLVLPLLGPSSVRDAVGRVPDTFLQVYPYVDPATRNVLWAGNTIDTRADLLAAERMIRGERYIFIRNAYLQNREFRVRDGEVVDDF